MAEKRVFVCDICGAEQAATNHWFAIIITEREHGNALLLGGLGSISPELEADRIFHLCGEACASKKISEFLGAKG